MLEYVKWNWWYVVMAVMLIDVIAERMDAMELGFALFKERHGHGVLRVPVVRYDGVYPGEVDFREMPQLRRRLLVESVVLATMIILESHCGIARCLSMLGDEMPSVVAAGMVGALSALALYSASYSIIEVIQHTPSRRRHAYSHRHYRERYYKQRIMSHVVTSAVLVTALCAVVDMTMHHDYAWFAMVLIVVSATAAYYYLLRYVYIVAAWVVSAVVALWRGCLCGWLKLRGHGHAWYTELRSGATSDTHWHSSH